MKSLLLSPVLYAEGRLLDVEPRPLEPRALEVVEFDVLLAVVEVEDEELVPSRLVAACNAVERLLEDEAAELLPPAIDWTAALALVAEASIVPPDRSLSDRLPVRRGLNRAA